MARHQRYTDKPHARFYGAWADLPAWRVLRPEAKVLLVELLLRYRPGKNLLTVGGRTAADWVNCSRPTIAKAFEELEECGWLTVERIGKPRGPRERRSASYALTMYTDDWGVPPTRAFEKWTAPRERLKPRPITAKKQATNGQ